MEFSNFLKTGVFGSPLKPLKRSQMSPRGRKHCIETTAADFKLASFWRELYHTPVHD